MVTARYSSMMVVRIYKHRKRRLYIEEWQKERGLSAETMAGRLDIERESYYRLLRERHRINTEKLAALADAMGIEPQDFYRPPERPSLDALIETAPQEIRETAIDIVRRLISKRTGT